MEVTVWRGVGKGEATRVLHHLSHSCFLHVLSIYAFWCVLVSMSIDGLGMFCGLEEEGGGRLDYGSGIRRESELEDQFG